MRWFKKETEEAVKSAIVDGLTALDPRNTWLRISYLDDPQPEAWAFPVYHSNEEILEIMVAPRAGSEK